MCQLAWSGMVSGISVMSQVVVVDWLSHRRRTRREAARLRKLDDNCVVNDAQPYFIFGITPAPVVQVASNGLVTAASLMRQGVVISRSRGAYFKVQLPPPPTCSCI